MDWRGRLQRSVGYGIRLAVQAPHRLRRQRRCLECALPLAGTQTQIQDALLHGQYRFSPLRRLQIEGEFIELWAALDALVLKALAIVLNRRLDFPRSCYHVPGKDGEKRGAKAAVRHICARLLLNQFVFRSDVKSYYASIDHAVLLALVRDHIDDRRVLDLVGQYLHRTVDENCLYSTVTRGISLGCPLSPVMAAIYLEPLDRRMEATGLTYARFMDDWVILAPTSWSLRRAVRQPDAPGTAGGAAPGQDVHRTD